MGKSAITKELILSTTIRMMAKSKDIDEVSIRNIATEAGVGLASVSYHFGNKDNLIQKAALSILEPAVEASRLLLVDERLSPKQRLKAFILDLSDVFMTHRQVTRHFLQSEFNKGDLNSAKFILPLLKEIYPDVSDELVLKSMAMQLVVPLQYMFLKEEAYAVYMGEDLDVEQNEAVKVIIGRMVDNLIGSDD